MLALCQDQSGQGARPRRGLQGSTDWPVFSGTDSGLSACELMENWLEGVCREDNTLIKNMCN